MNACQLIKIFMASCMTFASFMCSSNEPRLCNMDNRFVTMRVKEQTHSPAVKDSIKKTRIIEETMRQHTLSEALKPYRKMAVIINMVSLEYS